MTTRLPLRLKRMSRVPAFLLARGVPLGPLQLLRTTGRRTGMTRSVPVARTRFEGAEWLVAPFGATSWTLNARANPRAELGRGRRFRPVRLVEVHDERKARVLVHYRQTFRLVPFVRDAFRADLGPQPEPGSDQPADQLVFLVEDDAPSTPGSRLP